MASPRHERAKTQVVIDVFISIDVMNPAGFPVLYKNRIRLVVPVIARHTERNPLQRTLVRRRGLRRPLLVGCDFLLQCFVHNFSLNPALRIAENRCAGLFPAVSILPKFFPQTRRSAALASRARAEASPR